MTDHKLPKSYSTQLQSSPTLFSGPTYATVRVQPVNNGNANQTVAPGSTLQVNFFITPRVINLARTKLYYQLSIPAQGVNLLTALHNTTFGEIQSITLTPDAGRAIVDVQNANNYLRMIGLMSTPLDHFLDSTIDDGLSPSNTLANVNFTATPAQYQANGAVVAGVPVPATKNYTEVQHLQIQDTANVQFPAANATKTRRISLGRFKGTLFTLDKDIYFPQTMTLSVVFTMQKVGFSVNPANDPPAAAAALIGNMTLSNMNLLLQCETRPDIIEQVQNYYKQPNVRIPIEFLKFFKTSQSGAQHNPQFLISSSDGMAIRRIITSPFAQTEVSNYALDNSNIADVLGQGAAGKLISYHSVLDSEILQKVEVSCIPANTAGPTLPIFPSDDWEYNRKFLKGSAIQDQKGYNKSWFHMDDFLGAPDLNSVDAYSVGGLKTDIPRKYEIVAQVAKDSGLANYLTLSWYMYAIMGRELIFRDTSIDIL